MEDRRENVARELLATERSYVADIEAVVMGFMPANSGVSGHTCLSPYEWGIVFSNIEAVLACNRAFLARLEMAMETGVPTGGYGALAPCFTDIRSEFAAAYSDYCRNYRQAELFLISRKEDKAVQAYIRACAAKRNMQLGLEASLLKPIQRILKYPLLLHELAKHSPDGAPEYAVLVNAKATMDALASEINDRARADGEEIRALVELIQGWTGDEYCRGRKIAEAEVLVSKTISRKGPAGMVTVTRKSTKSRVCVLFERAIMLLSRRVIHMRHKYAVSADIPLNRAAVLTAEGEGLPHAWQILNSATHKKYIIQHRTAEEKAEFGTTVLRQLFKVAPPSVPPTAIAPSLYDGPESSRNAGDARPHHRSLPDLAITGPLVPPEPSVASSSATSLRPAVLTKAGLLSLPQTPTVPYVPSTGNSTPTSSDSDGNDMDPSVATLSAGPSANGRKPKRAATASGDLLDVSADIDNPSKVARSSDGADWKPSTGLQRRNVKRVKARDSGGGRASESPRTSGNDVADAMPDASGAQAATGGGASPAPDVLVAVVAYQPFEGDPDSLPLVVGDVVRLLRDSDGLGDRSRWLVSKGSQRGLVPAAVLKPLRVEPAEAKAMSKSASGTSVNSAAGGRRPSIKVTGQPETPREGSQKGRRSVPSSPRKRSISSADGAPSVGAAPRSPQRSPANSRPTSPALGAPPATQERKPRSRRGSRTSPAVQPAQPIPEGSVVPEGAPSAAQQPVAAPAATNTEPNGTGPTAESAAPASAPPAEHPTADLGTSMRSGIPVSRGVVKVTGSNGGSGASTPTTPRMQRTISVRAVVVNAADGTAAAKATVSSKMSPTTARRAAASEPKAREPPKRVNSLQGKHHVTNSPFIAMDRSMTGGGTRKRTSKPSTMPAVAESSLAQHAPAPSAVAPTAVAPVSSTAAHAAPSQSAGAALTATESDVSPGLPAPPNNQLAPYPAPPAERTPSPRAMASPATARRRAESARSVFSDGWTEECALPRAPPVDTPGQPSMFAEAAPSLALGAGPSAFGPPSSAGAEGYVIPEYQPAPPSAQPPSQPQAPSGLRPVGARPSRVGAGIQSPAVATPTGTPSSVRRPGRPSAAATNVANEPPQSGGDVPRLQRRPTNSSIRKGSVAAPGAGVTPTRKGSAESTGASGTRPSRTPSTRSHAGGASAQQTPNASTPAAQPQSQVAQTPDDGQQPSQAPTPLQGGQARAPARTPGQSRPRNSRENAIIAEHGPSPAMRRGSSGTNLLGNKQGARTPGGEPQQPSPFLRRGSSASNVLGSARANNANGAAAAVASPAVSRRTSRPESARTPRERREADTDSATPAHETAPLTRTASKPAARPAAPVVGYRPPAVTPRAARGAAANASPAVPPAERPRRGSLVPAQ